MTRSVDAVVDEAVMGRLTTPTKPSRRGRRGAGTMGEVDGSAQSCLARRRAQYARCRAACFSRPRSER